MKAIKLIFVGLILPCALYAQDMERVVLKRVSHTEVPVAVTTSVERDFPGVAVDEINIIPGTVYYDEWQVTEAEDKLDNSDEVMFYAIQFYGDKKKGEVVYNEDGEIVNFKETITDEMLPRTISEFIGGNYPGWGIIKDKEVIKTSPSGKVDKYKVTIRKGKDTKTLFFDSSGKSLERI